MSYHIRKAIVKDTEAICRLSYQLGYESSVEAIQDRLDEILKDNYHCIFVALDEKKVVGWIHAFYTLRVESEPFVEIGGLVVDKNYRNQGIGKMLTEKVTDWARSINCSKIRVRTNTIRKETHNFYNAIGFSESKEQKIFDKKL